MRERVSVCVRERERERKSVSASAPPAFPSWLRPPAEKESVWACVCGGEKESERERARVCERDRERECVLDREKAKV